MARYTESRELVQQIARATLEEGRSVSNSEVSALIFEKTGVRASPNLVADELQRFWAVIGRELAQRNQIPAVPTPVAGAVESVWRLAVEEADARWGRERSSFTEETARLSARVAQLEQTLSAQVSQYQQAEGMLQAQRARAGQAEAALAQRDEALATATQAITALNSEVAALKEQLAAAQQVLLYGEREAQALRERAQDGLSRLAAVQAQLQESEEETRRLRAQLLAAERQVAHHTSEAAVARVKLERLEYQIRVQDRRETRASRRLLPLRKPGGIR